MGTITLSSLRRLAITAVGDSGDTVTFNGSAPPAPAWADGSGNALGGSGGGADGSFRCTGGGNAGATRCTGGGGTGRVAREGAASVEGTSIAGLVIS